MKHLENDYKRQLTIKAKELAGAASYERKAKTAKVKDPAMFDPDLYRGEGSLLFPVRNYGKTALTLLLCLFSFSAPAQNRVTLMNISTKYVEFTWDGDTLNNVEFAPFFLALDYAEPTAIRMASELTNSLMMRPTAVSEISADMERTLFGITLDNYACFFHLREYRARIVKR